MWKPTRLFTAGASLPTLRTLGAVGILLGVYIQRWGSAPESRGLLVKPAEPFPAVCSFVL